MRRSKLGENLNRHYTTGEVVNIAAGKQMSKNSCNPRQNRAALLKTDLQRPDAFAVPSSRVSFGGLQREKGRKTKKMKQVSKNTCARDGIRIQIKWVGKTVARRDCLARLGVSVNPFRFLHFHFFCLF